jgi:cobalt transporter subunit CbtB
MTAGVCVHASLSRLISSRAAVRSLPLEDLMTVSTLSDTRTGSLVTDRKVLGALSLVLGLGFVFLVGFSPMSAVHNAAHDTRHTAAFPCH